MQSYVIAGLRVRMACEGRTERQAIPYQAEFEGEPDITIDVPETVVERECRAHPELNADDWRYLLTGKQFAGGLLDHNGLVLHASAVVVGGQAYLFAAPSGGGKSTHTKLWLETFPQAFILNDDKPALRLDESGNWQVYGTPWSGTEDISRNVSAPLAGICFLDKGEEDRIVPADDGEAAVRLYEQASRLRQEQQMSQMLSLIDRLIADIPLYQMTCTITPNAAQMSYRAMQGGK